MTKTTRLHMRSDDAFDARIEDWRANFRVEGKIPPMAQAVRILVEYALEHMPTAQKGHDAPTPSGKAKDTPEPAPAPITPSRPAKAASKPQKLVRMKSKRKPSSGELERRRIRKLITDAPGWEAYREARGYKVESLGKMALCREIAKDLGVAI